MKKVATYIVCFVLGGISFLTTRHAGALNQSVFLDLAKATSSLNITLKPSSIDVSKIIPSSEKGSLITMRLGKAIWESYIIEEDRTLNVPSEFSTISSAFDYLERKIILSDATVTIQIADGTYNLSSPIELYHSSGKNIQILGNISSPSSVVFNFSGVSGFVFNNNSKLGLIDGVTISGDDSCNCFGIYVNNNSIINVGSNMVVKDFQNGIMVRHNSSARVGGLYSSNLYSGIQVIYNSSLATETGTISSNNDRGMSVSTKSSVQAQGSSMNNNTSFGYSAWLFGTIQAGTATGNGDNYSPDKDTEGSEESFIR